MLLSSLFANFPLPVLSAPGEALITDVVGDHRKVTSGALFVAIKGSSFDGHRLIPDALALGAAAVVGTEAGLQPGVPYVQVADSRRALAHLAAAFHGYPARQMTMIGVTGTDGKTTTCNLLYHILQAAGKRAGMISTVNAVIGSQVLDTGFHVTTPDAPDVQRYLAMMAAHGLTHAVLETTSHGWAQFRVDACEFDIAVVTNITHEHLNDHGSFENYRAAKVRLFQSLAETQTKPGGNIRLALLNRDDSSYEYLAGVCTAADGVRIADYSRTAGAAFWAEEIGFSAAGLRFVACGPGFRLPVQTRLLGLYNVSNCLAALAAAVEGLGIDPQAAARGMAALPGIPGRMEFIDLGQDFMAIVDFAHTPNALDVTLDTARQITSGRVIAVFGSAGLRDRQKRLMMAEISARKADISILTAEDPRTESLDAILAEMAGAAIRQGGVEEQTFWRVLDRGEALRLAVSLARPGDLVLACGKGHEQSMCFGATEYAWDDRTALRAALAEKLGLSGYPMPYLPTQEVK